MDKFITEINGKVTKTVEIKNPTAAVDGNSMEYKVLSEEKNQIVLEINSNIYNVVYSKKSNEKFQIVAKGQNYEVEVLTELQDKAKKLNAERRKNSGETLIKAPMPGLVLRMEVEQGNEVAEGTSLFILEAMKMENEIKSEISGTIKEVKVSQGESVEKGAVILIIE